MTEAGYWAATENILDGNALGNTYYVFQPAKLAQFSDLKTVRCCSHGDFKLEEM